MLLADVWVRADNWKEAASEYEAVIALDPDHLEAHSGMANCRFALQEIEAARVHYSHALEISPDYVPASIGLAKCDCRLAHTESAAQRFESLLQNQDLTEQLRVDVLIELSQIRLRDQRDPERALLLLREAESLAPNHHQAHVMLASVHRRLGDEAVASQHEAKSAAALKRLDQLTDITRSLIKSPKDAELRYRAGQIFMEQGMMREGAEWLSTALIFDPDHREAHLALARYYDETGEQKIAARHRQMAGK
jgi:tetratricopeptide (TPR) repeat protein